MSTGLPVFDTTVQESNLWLKDAMEHLHTEDRHLAYLALRGTLHALRDRIGPRARSILPRSCRCCCGASTTRAGAWPRDAHWVPRPRAQRVSAKFGHRSEHGGTLGFRGHARQAGSRRGLQGDRSPAAGAQRALGLRLDQTTPLQRCRHRRLLGLIWVNAAAPAGPLS